MSSRFAARSFTPSKGSTNSPSGQPDGHRVDREVAPGEIGLDVLRERDRRLAFVLRIALLPEGRDLEQAAVPSGSHRPEAHAHEVLSLRPTAEQAGRLRRRGVGREVGVRLRRDADPSRGRGPRLRPGTARARRPRIGRRAPSRADRSRAWSRCLTLPPAPRATRSRVPCAAVPIWLGFVWTLPNTLLGLVLGLLHLPGAAAGGAASCSSTGIRAA